MIYNNLQQMKDPSHDNSNMFWQNISHIKEKKLCEELKVNPDKCISLMTFLVENLNKVKTNIDFIAKFIRCIPSELKSHPYLDKISNLIKNDCRLLLACSEDRPKETITKLIKFGAHPDCVDDWGSPLHYASASKNINIMTAIIRIEGKNCLNFVDSLNRTPLHIASQYGHFDGAIKLIETGFKIDALDHFGMTPAHYACQYGHVEIFKKFIQTINPHLCDFFGNSFLHYAREVEIACAVISHGAKIDATNQLGLTPMHLAAQSGNLELVSLFIKAFADINVQDNKGNTPLHYATINKNVKIMRFLVCKKARLNVPNALGLTPLHIVCQGGEHSDVTFSNLLDFAGADPQVIDKKGNTPLHYACMYNHLKMAKDLIRENVNLLALNFQSMTPLCCAILEKNDVALSFFSDFNFWHDLLPINTNTSIKTVREHVNHWLQDQPECTKGRSILEIPLLLGMNDLVIQESKKMSSLDKMANWLILKKRYPHFQIPFSELS